MGVGVRMLHFKCGHPKHGRNAMPRSRLGIEGVCCRICKDASNRKWRRAKPLEHFRAQKVRLRKARIAPLLKKQKGRCAICKRKMRFPYEDHQHSCCKVNPGCAKCRRGLLCPSCNGGLHLIEDERLHQAAIAYLKKWK